jgi:hypothetical protein
MGGASSPYFLRSTRSFRHSTVTRSAAIRKCISSPDRAGASFARCPGPLCFSNGNLIETKTDDMGIISPTALALSGRGYVAFPNGRSRPSSMNSPSRLKYPKSAR